MPMPAFSPVAESTPGSQASGQSPARQAAQMAQAACHAAATSSALSQGLNREDAGLPVLSGSAAEVAAALPIRARALRRLRLDLAERIREEASARWWIDHRHQVCG